MDGFQYQIEFRNFSAEGRLLSIFEEGIIMGFSEVLGRGWRSEWPRAGTGLQTFRSEGTWDQSSDSCGRGWGKEAFPRRAQQDLTRAVREGCQTYTVVLRLKGSVVVLKMITDPWHASHWELGYNSCPCGSGAILTDSLATKRRWRSDTAQPLGRDQKALPLPCWVEWVFWATCRH